MKVEIIAELAQGFEGKPEQARLLIRAAANSGADAAKFQLVYADELATPDYKYYDLFRSLEMPDQVWKELVDYAHSLNIDLYLDIFGTRSLILAESIGVQTIKLHGTDISNIGLLNMVCQSSIPYVLLGAGGAYASELRTALEILESKKVCVFAGFQGYPTSTESNQISRIGVYVKSLGKIHPNVKIGFADHTDPIDPLRFAIPAVALGAGATVFEKHLTLGKNMKLEDFEAALNPDEFQEFTRILRDCYYALGVSAESEDYGMSESEIGYRKMIRRHVVTSNSLESGKVLEPQDLVLKRTSSENFITDINSVYNKRLANSISRNAAVTPSDIV
ncbi:MAG: N-acetylneuraminate synthase family protein [Daejeonella sp.]|uniref:N-acetylneuraminate synthase family protein n=1 Tax=Daejeonella sp. TaxID=2805397 RepID=UPI002735E7F8|nr:N-acetylneuraminate synthase family protein [Daejeonella sp.]MDP3467535.1 N-acetylneuraminate synthase family protein [Daejeonella sp.]